MDRNSFVFYKDWRDAIKDLPNDIRLEIYDSIVEYAFSGEVSGLKPMASIAFNFIKGDIDRNMRKWKDAKSKKSDAGRLGNLKRWNEDLYNAVASGSMELDEAEKIAKDRTAINGIAKVAINANVNVNENVNVIKEKDTKVSKKKTVVFYPPSLKEVQEYCQLRKNNVDPIRFVNFYQSKGWMVGSNKMKDWQASVRTWEKENKKHAIASHDNSVNYEEF